MLQELSRLEVTLEEQENNLTPLLDKATQLDARIEELEGQKAILAKRRGDIITNGKDEEALKELGNQILLITEDTKVLSAARAELTQQVDAKKEEITRIRGQYQDVKRLLDEEKARQIIEALKGQGREAMTLLDEIVAKMVFLDKDRGVQYRYWWTQGSQISSQIFA